MTTTVANIRDGWPEEGFYIGRAGHGLDGYFGNPFTVGPRRDREQAIDAFRNWFVSRVQFDPEYRARVEALRGRVLVCFCKPSACHGDVIAAYLNE